MLSFFYMVSMALTANGALQPDRIFIQKLIGIFCIAAFIVVIILLYEKSTFLHKKLRGGVTALRGMIAGNEAKEVTDFDTLDELIEATGYLYDDEQDIFYSTLNPWQKKYGYSRLYDEASAPFGMIVDCEPIYFIYGGKIWLIEFWKGQYGMCCGFEIGVYTKKWLYYYPPKDYGDFFYEAASDSDLLSMSCSLKKNEETLFYRKEKHWWLTGFKLGDFANPSELTMDISITLKDENMRDAFISGLKNTGYSDSQIKVEHNTVSLVYNKPYSMQPFTRTIFTDRLIQNKNKKLCDRYQEITKGCDDMRCKIKAIRQYSPDLYELITNIGRAKKYFEYSHTEKGN